MCIEEIGDSDDDIPERLLKKSFAITLPKYYDPNKPILNGKVSVHILNQIYIRYIYLQGKIIYIELCMNLNTQLRLLSPI